MAKWTKRFLAAVLAVFTVFAAGCGLFQRAPEELTAEHAQMNTLLVCKDGSLEGLLVEEFPETYQVEELRAYVENAVNAFNTENGAGAVTVKEVTAQEGKAVVILKYRDAADFAAFNAMDMQQGVGHHVSNPPKTVKNPKGEETDAKTVMTDQYQAVYLGVPAEGENAYRVITFAKVAYYDGGELTDPFTVTGDGTKPITVLYKVKK